MALFLVMIVPVDYFVLGHVNSRRFTWALLPIVSLLFTGFTTCLGNAFLGSTDDRTSLEIVNLTMGNRVIRGSRFELLFTATQREVATELKQTLQAEMSLRRETEEREWQSYPSRGMVTSEAADPATERILPPQDSEPPLCDGNTPALFTVRRQMRK